MALKRRGQGLQDTRSWALFAGLIALLLPAPAFANLAEQIGYGATSFLESVPAILWTARGLAGLFGVILIVAGFRLYMRLFPVLGGAFVAMVGYDLNSQVIPYHRHTCPTEDREQPPIETESCHTQHDTAETRQTSSSPETGLNALQARGGALPDLFG